MTPEQIVTALDRYIGEFKVKPSRFDATYINPTAAEILSHCHWMAIEAKSFAATKPAKAMRWLCFIQGALWAEGNRSIEEFKADNRSEE
jgi:hypothetical protein